MPRMTSLTFDISLALERRPSLRPRLRLLLGLGLRTRLPRMRLRDLFLTNPNLCLAPVLAHE